MSHAIAHVFIALRFIRYACLRDHLHDDVINRSLFHLLTQTFANQIHVPVLYIIIYDFGLADFRLLHIIWCFLKDEFIYFCLINALTEFS